MPGIIVTDSIQLALGGTDGVGAPEIQDGSITDAEVAAANKDGLAATPSLRTLGTGAQQAAAGNDPRLSDARDMTVKEQGGAGPFVRGTLNLIEGSNVTITVADDAGNDEIDVTIASTGGPGGTSTFARGFMLMGG